MTRFYTLRPELTGKWLDILERAFQYDFYHLPSYHSLAEEQGEGQAYLFVYEEGRHFIALPLILRPIESVPGLRGRSDLWDASSVYGYAGPIASQPDMPTSVINAFQTRLTEALFARNIVAIFSRLHPLIPQKIFLSGLGEVVVSGQTVSIDLTLPLEKQEAQYRKGHKYDLKKLERLGVVCIHDANMTYLGDFIEIYHESMHRVGASPHYLFGQTYFEKLVRVLGEKIHLFVCKLEGQVISGGLFILCDGIVQYHLAGSKEEFLQLASMKLVIDRARIWATEQGAHTLHLGGGVSSQADTLFDFKAGFSKRRHMFCTWRWIVKEELYKQLCAEKAYWNEKNQLKPISDYFPAYRAPTAPLNRLADEW